MGVTLGPRVKTLWEVEAKSLWEAVAKKPKKKTQKKPKKKSLVAKALATMSAETSQLLCQGHKNHKTSYPMKKTFLVSNVGKLMENPSKIA